MILLDASKDPVSIDDVVLEHIDKQTVISPDVAELVDTLWEEEIKQARQRGKILYDSMVYQFVSHETTAAGSLKIVVASLQYSLRYAAKKSLDIASKVGPLGAMFTHILIKTQDDQYLFGKKSSNYVTDLNTCFIGGVFEGSTGLKEHVLGESLEELSIGEHEIGALSVLGIYQNEIGNVGVVIMGNTRLSAREIQDRLQSVNKETNLNELSAIIPVSSEETTNFIQSNLTRYSDVAELLERYNSNKGESG